MRTLSRSAVESISRTVPRAAVVAPAGQCDRGVVADVAVGVVEPLAEELRGGLAAEEAEGIDGHLAELGVAVAAGFAQGGDGAGVVERPSSRAACLARLTAAALRTIGGCFGGQRPGQHRDRIERLSRGRPRVEGLEGAERQGHVPGQLRVSFMVQVVRQQVGQLAEQVRGSPASLASFRIRLASSKALRQVAPDRAEQPDVLPRVALAAGQLAEEEPDDDHHGDHQRRDHEQLDDEAGRRCLDRRQLGREGARAGRRRGAGRCCHSKGS